MNNVVLISIHPEHAGNIINGKKTFEYRKIVPKSGVSHLALYCTDPVKKIVAIVEVLGVKSGSPSRIWDETAFGAGIPRHFYRQYFAGQKVANAFQLGRVFSVREAIDLSLLSGNKVAPQSFYYLDDADVQLILNRQSERPSTEEKMLFIGGIHGVGKTTICKKAFSSAGYRCVTASSLIAADRNRAEAYKRAEDVGDNQVALLRQLAVEKSRYCRLLLDGHFTLINSADEIEPIDVEVFKAIKPDMLILIKGSSAEIAARLRQRDGRSWKTSFLEKFQEMEEVHARYVATDLRVPLRTFTNDIGYAAIVSGVRKDLDEG